MQILTPRRELILPAHFGMAGWWKLVATNVRTGRQRLVADWFPNLITDYGLNLKGTVDSLGVMHACHVGSGSTAPANTDTTLETWVASSNTQQGLSVGAEATAPYYGWRRKTYRFGEGVAAGNLSEIGAANLTGSTDPLFSRALILDGLGSPTTITVLADEILDAIYELRMYPPTTDGSFSVADGATTYSITTRAANVTSASQWGDRIDDVPTISTRFQSKAYSGVIGAIESDPGGTPDFSSSVTKQAYANNSLTQGFEILFGLNAGNVGGIKSIDFGDADGSTGKYQVEFNPPIAKDDTKELTIGVQIGWGRAAI